MPIMVPAWDIGVLSIKRSSQNQFNECRCPPLMMKSPERRPVDSVSGHHNPKKPCPSRRGFFYGCRHLVSAPERRPVDSVSGHHNPKKPCSSRRGFFYGIPTILLARLWNFAHGLRIGMRLRRICIFIHYAPTRRSAFFVIQK